MTKKKTITCKETLSTTKYMVRPEEVNDKDTMFGGSIVDHMDVVSSFSLSPITGARHLTVGIQDIQFFYPPKRNDYYTIESFVTGIGKSSLEVFVRFIVCDDFFNKKHVATSAFYTFYPVWEEGERPDLPILVPETEEEIYLCSGYEDRKARAKESRLAQESFHQDLVS